MMDCNIWIVRVWSEILDSFERLEKKWPQGEENVERGFCFQDSINNKTEIILGWLRQKSNQVQSVFGLQGTYALDWLSNNESIHKIKIAF